MKLNRYEVRMNYDAQMPELFLGVVVPISLIEETDSLTREEAGRILGSKLLEIFDEIKRNESKR